MKKTIITKNNTKWNDIVVSLQMRKILNLNVEMELAACVCVCVHLYYYKPYRDKDRLTMQFANNKRFFLCACVRAFFISFCVRIISSSSKIVYHCTDTTAYVDSNICSTIFRQHRW